MRKLPALIGASALLLGAGLFGGAAVLTQTALAQPPTRVAAGAVPSAYADAVASAGASCGLPGLTAPVLAAQLRQESGWNPRAVSPAGAQGLAQFMPGTWARYGVDGDGDGVADVWNAYDAITSAAVYDCAVLAAVKDVPGPPTSLMLAAYNVGPGAVIRYQGIPPYSETQNYVTSILAAAAAYTAGPVAASSAGLAAVGFAVDKLGTPYLWGGETEFGYDCSGLTLRSWEAAGVQLPRTSRQQWYAGPHPARDELAPGDLVFFANDLGEPSSIHHVGLYIGGGWMIDAPHTGAVVRFANITGRPDYFGATRPGA